MVLEVMFALLAVCSVLLAWIGVWRLVLRRCVARGGSLWLGHPVGAVAGAGAALAVFVLALSFGLAVMTGRGDQPFWPGVQMGVGILLAYAWAFGAQCRITCPAFVRTLLVRAGAQIGRAWSGLSGQMHCAAQALRAGWARFMRHIDRRAEQAAALRAEREAALGMSFGAFVLERYESHFKLWCLAGFMAIWGGFFWLLAPAQEIGGFMLLLLSFVLATVVGAFVMLGFVLTLLMIQLISDTLASIFLFILLPLPLLSIWLEARWRMRWRRPYTLPPVTGLVDGNQGSTCDVKAGHAWCGMFALALLATGFLLGSAWAGDDE